MVQNHSKVTGNISTTSAVTLEVTIQGAHLCWFASISAASFEGTGLLPGHLTPQRQLSLIRSWLQDKASILLSSLQISPTFLHHLALLKPHPQLQHTWAKVDISGKPPFCSALWQSSAMFVKWAGVFLLSCRPWGYTAPATYQGTENTNPVLLPHLGQQCAGPIGSLDFPHFLFWFVDIAFPKSGKTVMHLSWRLLWTWSQPQPGLSGHLLFPAFTVLLCLSALTRTFFVSVTYPFIFIH